MVNPVILLMRWFQIIPIALLMIFPFTEWKLRLGEQHRPFITVSFTILGWIALGVLSIVSVVKAWNWDLCLATLLVIYFSGWLYTVHTPTVYKLLAGGVMLHYAAMLNAIGNIFMAFVLDGNYPANIKANDRFLVFCLCFLTANIIFLLLTWYFLRRVLRERLLIMEEQDAKQGLLYLCIMFVLFCLVAYNPGYDFKIKAPLIIVVLVVTNMIACIMFFRRQA